MTETTSAPREMIRAALANTMEPETCHRFYLPEGATWLKALMMAQFQRALEGDSAAFKTLLEVAYPEGQTIADEATEDELSRALREWCESIKL